MLAPLPTPTPASQGEPSLALPRSFWKDFAKRHWDREAAVFKQPFGNRAPTTGQIYEALLDAGERVRRGEYTLPLRFFIEHEEGPDGLPYYSMLMSLSNHMPRPEDGGVEGYLARLDELLGGKRFGIVFNRLQMYQWTHWQQLSSFLTGLYDAVGVPLGNNESCVFFGNYRYTPFGIHKDNSHAFNLVVEGKKTYSLWPFEMLASREEVPKDPSLIHRPYSLFMKDKAEEKEVLSRATFIEASAGDVAYWPVSFWHRAEPTQGLNISISVSACASPPMFTSMAPPLEWPSTLRSSDLPGKKSWQVPAAVRSALRQRGQRKALLAAERESTIEWVRCLTARAVDAAPPEAQEAPLTPTEWIRAHPERPIVCVPLPGKQLLVSAIGRSTTLPSPPPLRRRVERLVSALNAGKPLQVEALEAAFFSRLPTRAFKREAFRALLDDLVRWRAVRRCPPPGRKSR
ncbi:hypothetical protein JQX13_00180 [Archangium violaceum]|uniref:cupin-like domain-containing protein n=1 Tax=Archangium violaceum TaxID=83451 RepID=UPI00193C6197|nr:cupin-like domain-containing protein [Archangium violaceum]QRK08649.1 hypothetical protein JQX13_00180 [Archangium violaceum]